MSEQGLGRGIQPSNWEFSQFFDNMTTISGNINKALSKVGANNYIEFFQARNCFEWTSSEYSASWAILIDSGVNNGKGAGSLRFDRNTSAEKTIAWMSNDPWAVRPFLAF